MRAWYIETASSVGTRPQLRRLLDDCARGKITRVIVYRLDRFSRRGIADLLFILETLRSAGVELISIADGFDLAGPFREILAAVLGYCAEVERAAIRERVSAARQRHADLGIPWGRPARAAPRVVGRVRRLHAEGRTVRAIAIALKLPKSTVHNILSQKGVYAECATSPKKTGVRG